MAWLRPLRDRDDRFGSDAPGVTDWIVGRRAYSNYARARHRIVLAGTPEQGHSEHVQTVDQVAADQHSRQHSARAAQGRGARGTGRRADGPESERLLRGLID